MRVRPQKKGARQCCCCIPIRAGIITLAIVYFLCGIAATVAAFLILFNGSFELTIAANAIVVALAVLSVFVTITSAIGIFASIRQGPRSARLYFTLFSIWFFLQLALDIALVVMIFKYLLDSLIPECANISGRRGGSDRQSVARNCERARNRASWYYVVGAVVRNSVMYYFVRRVSSFSRHCAERSKANLSSTQMTQTSASTPGQPGFQSWSSKSPQAHQASADSLQEGKVGEAPVHHNTSAEKAV